jgi:hypothetical protein
MDAMSGAIGSCIDIPEYCGLNISGIVPGWPGKWVHIVVQQAVN